MMNRRDFLGAAAAAPLSFFAKSDDAPAGSHMPYQESATRSMPLCVWLGCPPVSP